MVGSTIGQFVSRECKHSEWKLKDDAHCRAQIAWRDFIKKQGGDAMIVTGTGSL
jgi:hypothetical protein